MALLSTVDIFEAPLSKQNNSPPAPPGQSTAGGALCACQVAGALRTLKPEPMIDASRISVWTLPSILLPTLFLLTCYGRGRPAPKQISRQPIGEGCRWRLTLSGCPTRRSDARFGSIESVRRPEQQSFERLSITNGASPVRESLQAAVEQPLVRPAPPRRDDRYLAETVNSPAGRQRQQRLPSRHSNRAGQL